MLNGNTLDEKQMNGEMNALGTGYYEPSRTKTLRNPKAAELSQNWQRLTQQHFKTSHDRKNSSGDDNDKSEGDDSYNFSDDEEKQGERRFTENPSKSSFMKRKDSSQNFPKVDDSRNRF